MLTKFPYMHMKNDNTPIKTAYKAVKFLRFNFFQLGRFEIFFKDEPEFVGVKLSGLFLHSLDSPYVTYFRHGELHG